MVMLIFLGMLVVLWVVIIKCSKVIFVVECEVDIFEDCFWFGMDFGVLY